MAVLLRERGVTVFYDKFETASLWGKNLYDHLAFVYKDAATYCIMFLSTHYANKLWTNHERKHAQARAFREQSEYILPIRLDDAEIPGITETIGYVDLHSLSMPRICDLVCQKLGDIRKNNTLSAGQENERSFARDFSRNQHPKSKQASSRRDPPSSNRQLPTDVLHRITHHDVGHHYPPQLVESANRAHRAPDVEHACRKRRLRELNNAIKGFTEGGETSEQFAAQIHERGDVYEILGQLDEAMDDFGLAARILERLVKEGGQHELKTKLVSSREAEASVYDAIRAAYD